MNHRYVKTGMPCLLAAVALTGCIDDGYDLSNIDTTSKFTVNDLTIPINLDAITLGSVIEIEEDSQIQVFKDADGKEYYAVKESGDFHSDPIFVDYVKADAPEIAPAISTLTRSSIGQRPERVASRDAALVYPITETSTSFAYDISNVDESIHEIVSAKVNPLVFSISLSVPDFGSVISGVEFTDVRIQMPKGLTATTTAGSYDASTGILTIDKLEAQGTTARLAVTVTEINFKANGAILDPVSHSFSFGSQFNVEQGNVNIYPSASGTASIPETIQFTARYTVGDIEATAFTGRIEYKLEGVDINDVDLSSIPDFLADESTNISLVNPQIYLNLTNPVGTDGVDCSTGLTLTANRENRPSASYSLDEGAFVIGHNAGDGPYNFCLSPLNPATPSPDFAKNMEWVKFSSLSDVLSGAGIPTSIGITLDDPQIPLQTVTDFELGKNIPGVEGKYEFLAPLALKDGSTIIYTDTQDGWGSEDLDAMTIEKFEITAKASTDLPVEVLLTATVLGKDGKPLRAELSSITLPANAKDYPISIFLGEGQQVTNLDGITFTAIVKAESEADLSPEQFIILRDVRARVSGNYTKDF